MLRTLTLFFLAVLFAMPCWALRRDLLITQYPTQYWSTLNGLPADTIRAVAQTNDGYIWFGTSAGLCRFNGKQCFVFNTSNTPAFKSNSITALLKDKKGILWIGTENGLLSYDQNQFKSFTVDEGLSDNTILSLAQDGSGNLWIRTSIDVNVYNGRTFSLVPVQHPTCIFADAQNVLIGTQNGFSIIANGKTVSVPGPAVTAIDRSKNGQIRAGTANGLYVWKENNFVPVIQCEEIRSILEDRDGNLWIGTARGLRLINKTSPLHPEIHNAVAGLFEDREGSIWVATSGDGVHTFQPSTLSMISAQEGLPTSRTWCVLLDRTGNLWIGTDDGVSRWFDQQTTNFHLPSAGKALAEDASGTIWAGTAAGALRLEGDSFQMKIPGVDATSIATQSNGDLWIGSADGLRLFSQGKLKQVSSDEITALYMDRGDQLWIGTKTGLKILKNEDLEDTKLTEEVSSMASDGKGNLWAGSGSKIYSISSKTRNALPLGQIGAGPATTGIAQDRQGIFWIASTRGIYRATNEKNKLCATELMPGRGLPSSEASTGQPAVAVSPEGARLWIATVNGVAQIDADLVHQKKTPPAIVIEGIEHDRIPVENFRTEKLIFSPETARIEFHYAALSYLPGVKYRYVLAGYDQFWTNAGNQTRAVYTNLPAGKYRFKVLAGRDDAWNIVGDSVAFEVEKGLPQVEKRSVMAFIFIGVIAFACGWFARRFILKEKI